MVAWFHSFKKTDRAPNFLFIAAHRANFRGVFQRSRPKPTEGANDTRLSIFLQPTRGHERHEHMLHPGWDSHPLRHRSHSLVLQAEVESSQQNACQPPRAC